MTAAFATDLTIDHGHVHLKPAPLPKASSASLVRRKARTQANIDKPCVKTTGESCRTEGVISVTTGLEDPEKVAVALRILSWR
jgi:hypothetical protein